jgi:hypothetical protein
MHIVYSSPSYHVVEFQGGIELIDKVHGVGGFLHGALADHFKDSFSATVARTPSFEAVDKFLDNFGALLLQPSVYH